MLSYVRTHDNFGEILDFCNMFNLENGGNFSLFLKIWEKFIDWSKRFWLVKQSKSLTGQ